MYAPLNEEARRLARILNMGAYVCWRGASGRTTGLATELTYPSAASLRRSSSLRFPALCCASIEGTG